MIKKKPRSVLRIVLWTFGGLVVLLLGGVAILLLTFDPNSVKPRIAEAVKQATGRDLVLKGNIGIAFSLRPTLQAHDIALSNPPGFSRPDMVTLDRMDLQLGLVPLLSRHVEIDRLILNKPDIRLETDAKGQPNWLFTPMDGAKPATAQVESGKSGPVAFDVAVQDVKVVDGAVSYRDGRTGQITALTLKEVATKSPSANAPLHVTATLAVNGTDIAITADTGPLSRLSDRDAGAPWPVKLSVQAGSSGVTMDGTVTNPRAGTGLDVALAAEIPDLSTLGSFARQNLSALQKMELRARITDAAGGPDKGIELHDLSFKSSLGDLSGDVAFTPGTPPIVAGTLKSDRIDADQWLKAQTTPSPTSPAQAAAGAVPPPAAAKPKRLFSDDPIAFGQLQLLNADLRFTVGTLHLGGADYKAMQGHLVLRDGVLKLDPAGADLPEGHLGLTVSVDAGQLAPPVHVTFQAPSVALKALLSSLGEPAYATGNLEIIGDLSGAGETEHAIASTLNGYLGVAVAGGAIETRQITGSAGEVLRLLNPQLSTGGAGALRCFAVRIDANKGIGTFRALALSTGLLTMDGSGSVNLADETLSMRLRSLAKVAGNNVTVPVQVSGPILSPHGQVDAIGIAEQNVDKLAGVTATDIAGKNSPIGMLGNALGIGSLPGGGTTDVCPGALALARNQSGGGQGAAPTQMVTDPAPASQPAPQGGSKAKPPNAAKLLQQLFR